VDDARASDQRYLQTIFEIEEDDVPAIRARISEGLGVSPAGVSEAVEGLMRRGYVVDDEHRRVRLTPSGLQIARSVVRRHRLSECLLHDVLGLAWEEVHREAARWEHVISAEVEERLADLLGDPATCPHGNRVPGSARPPDPRPMVVLSDAQPGVLAAARISERLQLDDDAIRLLVDTGLTPGRAVTVLSRTGNGVTIRTPAGDRLIPAPLATQIWMVAGS
jgi:DtxR family Mn-dependent transcriptional regulator